MTDEQAGTSAVKAGQIVVVSDGVEDDYMLLMVGTAQRDFDWRDVFADYLLTYKGYASENRFDTREFLSWAVNETGLLSPLALAPLEWHLADYGRVPEMQMRRIPPDGVQLTVPSAIDYVLSSLPHHEVCQNDQTCDYATMTRGPITATMIERVAREFDVSLLPTDVSDAVDECEAGIIVYDVGVVSQVWRYGAGCALDLRNDWKRLLKDPTFAAQQ